MTNKRQQIEDAAVETVQRGGLHSLSFRTLADEVGIKSSSVHYHFPEKSHLAEALLRSYRDNFNQVLQEIDSPRRSVKSKIDAFIEIFEQVLSEDKFCLCGMMAAEVEALSEPNRKLLAAYFQETEDWLTRVLSDEVTAAKPQTLARVILSGLEGAILIDRIEGGLTHIRAHRELIRELLDR